MGSRFVVAPEWHERLHKEDKDRDPVYWQEWINLVALAVNEENASGGRVVTAPTNGAAGIIPAVIFYATHYAPGAKYWNDEEKNDAVVNFLLTAGAVGVLYKEQASISVQRLGVRVKLVRRRRWRQLAQPALWWYSKAGGKRC